MHSEPEAWNKLMDTLATSTLAYLMAQVRAGAQAVQLFDSWIGYLSTDDYETFVQPSIDRIITGLADAGVPRILFGVGTAHLLSHFAASGTDVIGVDWRIGLDDARRLVGEDPVVQGNLDPAICLAPWEVVADRARDVLKRGGGRKHVFNLGHGVLPETDPSILERLVELVHDWSP